MKLQICLMPRQVRHFTVFQDYPTDGANLCNFKNRFQFSENTSTTLTQILTKYKLELYVIKKGYNDEKNVPAFQFLKRFQRIDLFLKYICGFQ